ncbi:hypothetical protein F7725_016377, partial [Dissostichus mawsoni]
MGRLRNNYTLPCIDGCAQPQIASAGVGRPRVIVGTGQYYLLSSRLCCKVCQKRWYADNPSWLEKLPKRFTNLLPAVLTYKKAICKSVMDELRRSGKSPTDMAKQITELMHLKYERADLAYLLSCKNIMDGEEGKYDQKTITQFLRQEIMYRHGGTLQLNRVPGEGAKVPVWIPIRGTSQQEGYHFHQAQWVTGTRVSTELFQAQAMTGVARWNYQRLVDLKQPDVKLPAVFDPALMGEINAVSQQVFGHVKYPAFHLPNRDTGEKFGLEYVEPDCRPVPLDWDKHRSKADSTQALDTPPQSSNPTAQSELLQPPSIPPTKLFQFPANPPSVKQDVTAGTTPEPHTESETTCLKSLPLLSSPTAARTGPVKTGGRVFVLDHKCWTGPMKQAVDNLLNKHHGQKDMLKLVDKDYAALVLDSCTDPNSMLHPTTKHHICQYVKHLSKLLNTSSSINISPEKLQERQVLWHSLTEGSETTSVPVVTMPVAVFNPTPPVQTPATPPVQTPATPLTLEHVENFVRNIMANQQQQQQQKKQTKRCLSCGQPKPRFENDGSSIHHFYMQGTVRYFYCSTNVFITYGAEGLTDPKMPFGDFAETAFFPRELEAMKQRVEGMEKQMTWKNFKEDAERDYFEWRKVGPGGETLDVFKYDAGLHYKNNGLPGQSEQFKGRVSHFLYKLKYGNASIVIGNTTAADRGNYTCSFPRVQPPLNFYLELVVGEQESEDSYSTGAMVMVGISSFVLGAAILAAVQALLVRVKCIKIIHNK